MPRYLSDEWFDAVSASLRQVPPVATQHTLVLQQIVTAGPEGDVSYAVVVEPGGVRVVRGEADHADATITQDYATATALVQGELTLQDAFMTGRIKVRGNMTALLTGQAALAGLDPLPASIREETSY